MVLTKKIGRTQPGITKVLLSKQLFQLENHHVRECLKILYISMYLIILVGRGIQLSQTLSGSLRSIRKNEEPRLPLVKGIRKLKKFTLFLGTEEPPPL